MSTTGADAIRASSSGCSAAGMLPWRLEPSSGCTTGAPAIERALHVEHRGPRRRCRSRSRRRRPRRCSGTRRRPWRSARRRTGRHRRRGCGTDVRAPRARSSSTSQSCARWLRSEASSTAMTPGIDAAAAMSIDTISPHGNVAPRETRRAACSPTGCRRRSGRDREEPSVLLTRDPLPDESGRERQRVMRSPPNRSPTMGHDVISPERYNTARLPRCGRHRGGDARRRARRSGP